MTAEGDTGEARGRRLRLRRPRLERRAVNQLIPNVLTVGALCAGLTSVRFATMERWEHAVAAIVIAVILDGLDGRAARLLNGTSKFGAGLNSLSDFVSFGAAPAVLVYLWSAQALGGLGWAAALFYAVCCALRLAQFNTMLGDPNPPPWSRFYFTGVPAPAGAGLALLPLIASFEVGPEIFDKPAFAAGVLVVIGALMVSRLPTFSIKLIKITRAMILPALMLAGIVAAALTSAPWTTLLVVGLVYLVSLPISIVTQARARRLPPPPADAPPESR